jgi:hypothetical protein
MKKIFVVCLLGIGMLLPTLKTTAKENLKKIIEISLEEDVLLASSSSEDGVISKIIITDKSRQTVASQTCGGYYCQVYVGNLPAGSYTAQIHTSRSGVNIIGFTITE